MAAIETKPTRYDLFIAWGRASVDLRKARAALYGLMTVEQREAAEVHAQALAEREAQLRSELAGVEEG